MFGVGVVWWVCGHVNMGKMDRGLVNKYMGYMGDIIGVPQSSVEQSMREFTGRFMKQLGLKNTAASNNIVKNIMATGYMSTMGFRPWLAIRNMQQVWTTLAPRIGNGWVDEGIGLLAKDTKGDIFRLLKAKGIISKTSFKRWLISRQRLWLLSMLTSRALPLSGYCILVNRFSKDSPMWPPCM